MNGSDLAAWRTAAGVSQAGLARASGMDRRSVIRAEAAADQPIPAKLLAAVERGETAAPVVKAKPAEAPVPPALAAAMRRNPPYAETAAEAKAMRELRALQRGVPIAHIRLLPLQPVWTRLDSGRRVNAAIPQPRDQAAPGWAGERGVLTASGAVYDMESAHRMQPPDLLALAQPTAGDW